MNFSDIQQGTRYAEGRSATDYLSPVLVLEVGTFEQTKYNSDWDRRGHKVQVKGARIHRLTSAGELAFRNQSEYIHCAECGGTGSVQVEVLDTDFMDIFEPATCAVCEGRCKVSVSKPVPAIEWVESRRLIRTWDEHLTIQRKLAERKDAKAAASAAAREAVEVVQAALKAAGLGGYTSYSYETGSVVITLSPQSALDVAAAIVR